MEFEYNPSPSIFNIRNEKRKAETSGGMEPRALIRGSQDTRKAQTPAPVETDRYAEARLADFQEKFDRQRAARQAGFERENREL